MDHDPLARLLALPGVREAAASVRTAIDTVHAHPANRRGWALSATEAAVRAARASAGLDGGAVGIGVGRVTGGVGVGGVTGGVGVGGVTGGVGVGGVTGGVGVGGVTGGVGVGGVTDPVTAGALRVAGTLDGAPLEALLGVWRRAPLQVLARLHLLAAAGLAAPDQLGRPRAGAGERLELLGQLVGGGTRAPAAVLAAVVHGELLGLRAFGTADGVVARAAARLVMVSTGLDVHNLTVPEVSWWRHASEYRRAADGFATGTPEDVAGWVVQCCAAMVAGAREATSIADAALS